MKKIFLGATLACALAMPAFAANNNPDEKENRTRTECCKHKEKGCDKGMDKKCDRGMKVLEELNLTDAQKTKLETLRKETMAKREAEMKKAREMKESGKEFTSEQKEKFKAEMKAKREQSKQEFLNGLKAILTPEQYTKFLESNFMVNDNHAKHMKKHGMHKKNFKEKKGSKNGQAALRHKDNKKGMSARHGERKAAAALRNA